MPADARRQQHHRYAAECTLDFAPDTYQAAAGLTTYYNRTKLHALMLSHEPDVGRVLNIFSCNGHYPEGNFDYPLKQPVPVGDGRVGLGVRVDHATQQFFWRQGDANWQAIGPKLNAAVISDEGGRGEHGSFTGAFVGMAAFDISGRGTEARFTRFSYDPT